MTKPTILIIAGGNNSRFAPLNTSRHKGFNPVAGVPLITRNLLNLKEHGFNDVVIVVTDRDIETVAERIGLDNLEMNIRVLLQKEAKGMGNAILSAAMQINNDFIVMSPYHLHSGSIAEKLWVKQKENKANCVLMATQTDNPELYGILDIDKNNPEKVLGVVEKPKREDAPSNLRANSVYLLEHDFIKELEETKQSTYSFEDALTTYAKKKYITWVEAADIYSSLKYPWHLFDFMNEILENNETNISSQTTIAKTAVIDDSRGAVIIEDGVRIGEFAKISGPCYIGKNCFIGDYAFVRGSSLEEESTVGAKTEVVRSILLEKSSIHFGYMADSILGIGSKIGAGLITANKRLDRKNIRVQVKGKLIDTETNSIGIITGENSSIGIRVNTMPGVLISAEAKVLPGSAVNRNIEK